MARRCELQNVDLARPAKELPLKTIKALGYLLHTHLHNSGNWETVAEDLGYCYEAIQQFSTNANVRQDCTPGELMLRDWIGRGTGRTLFVLRNALDSSDRQDCVQYLDQEINDKVLHMDLNVCIADLSGTNVYYQPIRTRTDASLRDSLQNVLDGPVRNYQLADSGTSWDSTIAREYKGQELKIYRLNLPTQENQEQDPTIDSSSHSFENNVEMQADPVPPRNELDRMSQRVPTVCQHLNIPATNNQSNLQQVESSQHCHSCTCGNRIQMPPGIVKKSVTIYDDQDLTKQDIKQIKKGQGTMKLDTSSLLDNQNSITLQKLPSYCVVSSSSDGIGQSYQNPDRRLTEGSSNCVTYSRSVGIAQQVQKSDTFYKEPLYSYATSNDTSECLSSYSSRNDSLTAQKQFIDNTQDQINLNLRSDIVAHSDENMNDSVTKVKEMHRGSRVVKTLVDYTPSNSGSDSFPESLNQRSSPGKSGAFSAFAADHAEYSFSVYNDSESQVHGEQYMYAAENTDTDSSMDTEVINAAVGVKNDVINFVNIDSVPIDEAQYQHFYIEHSGIYSGYYKKTDSFPSEMDCQSVSSRTDIQAIQNKNTPVESPSNDTIKLFLESVPKHTNSFEKVSVEADFEIDDPAYTEYFQTDNTHFLSGNKASNDLSNVVDDSAITTVNSAAVSTCSFNDLVDDSAITVVTDLNEFVCDSAINVVNVTEEFSGASNATVNNFVDDYAMKVVDDSAVNKTNASVNNVPTLKGEKSESFGKIEIYATSVIPGLEDEQTEGYKSQPKHHKMKCRSYQYETLQSFLSCPGEFGYEKPHNSKEIKFEQAFGTVDMPTIADAFTPVKDDFNLHDFLSKERKQWDKSRCSNMPIAVHSLDRGKKDRSAIQVESAPNRRSCTDVNKIIKNESLRRNLLANINSHENRPLPTPPVSDLDILSKGHKNSSRQSPPLPPKVLKLSPHPYKLVSGGKTSRPMLDQLLANDRLFVHYNTCLQAYPGWSPRETEYTVEKTLQSVIKSDGYYLLWYIRGRKRLALSISHLGKIIHYEVRTKVSEGQLLYYIFPDTVYPDIRLLLQFHESHGLRPQTDQMGEQTDAAADLNMRDSVKYSHVFMKCPVLVEYGPRLASSV